MDLLKTPSTVLEAVQTILPLMGYVPVVSLDESNSEVPKVLRLLAVSKGQLLAGHRWWFQKIHREVLPDSNGRYRLGADSVGFRPDNPEQAVYFNHELVHPRTGNPADIQGPVPGWEVLDVEFEALPAAARLWIIADAVMLCASATLSQADMQTWALQKEQAMLSMTQNQLDADQAIERYGWFKAQQLTYSSNLGGWDPIAGVYRVV